VFSDPVTAARDRGSRGGGCEQGEQGRRLTRGGRGGGGLGAGGDEHGRGDEDERGRKQGRTV
jgi:hypothetical protein